MGKNKYIESPEKMHEYWDSYVIHTKSRPFLVHDFVGKDGKPVFKEKERPLTQMGFEAWMYRVHKLYVGQYFDNLKGVYAEYLAVCTHIRAERTADQIEGGMAGIYNPSITQRLNGLVEKSQVETIVEQPLFSDVINNDKTND